jgi:T1SS-143 domain-containing protein
VVINFADGSLTGSSDPQSAQGDDPYVDGENFTVSVASTTGGNFEQLDTTDTALVTINDTIDTTTLTLNDVTVNEDGTLTYTASVDNAPQGAFAVTLDNGVVINFADGSLTGSSDPQSAQGDDPYVDGENFTVSVASTTGGNFEQLDTTVTALVTINDTIDTVTATLTTSTTQISEKGGSITYTVTLTGGPGNIDPDAPLVFTLEDGTEVTIAAGAISGSATRVYSDEQIASEQVITNGIVSYTGGSEYEQLITAGSTSVDVNYFPVVEPVAVRVSEEGLGGSDPDVQGNIDTTNVAYLTGSFSATDPDGDTLSFVFTSAPSGLTSNGAAIEWTGVGTGTLVGMAGGVTILTATLDATGTYSVALAGPLDHATQGEDELDLVFDVDVSDGTETVATTFTVTVEDDSPGLGAFDPGVIPSEVGTLSGQYELASGADGIDHFNIIGPSIGNVIYSTEVLEDGTTILHGNSAIDDSEIFSLTVRPDGTYTYDLINPDAGDSIAYAMTNLSSGNKTWVETADGGVEFSSSSTINSNANGFGVGNSFVGTGDFFEMEFHQPGTSTGDDPANSNPLIVDSVTLNVNQLNGAGGTYTWVATNTVTGGTEIGTITINSTGEFLINPLISFNTLTIIGKTVDGQGAQFASLSISQDILPDDLDLLFQVEAVDNDGDVSDMQQLAIHQVAWHPAGQGQATSGYTLTGSEGQVADWIAASSRVDLISGLDGFDVVDYSDSTSPVVVNLDESGHAAGAPFSNLAPEEGTIVGGEATGDTLSGIEGIVGGHGNDVLIGNSHANYFDGGAGADTINAEGGDDVVVYDGTDLVVDGNAGNDILIVKDAAQIDLSEVNDQSQGDVAIVTGFEHVDASASNAAVELTGDGKANTLIGGSGNDILDGGAGDDTLTGGKGADTFLASGGDDLITDYNKGEGDAVDISNLLTDATRDNLEVGSEGGVAKLTILDGGGSELGSVTFETIDNSDGSMSLDSLLDQVDVKDSHGTL